MCLLRLWQNSLKKNKIYDTLASIGEVTEWLMVLVLKTSVGQLTASSNLALSAIKNSPTNGLFFIEKTSYCVDAP